MAAGYLAIETHSDHPAVVCIRVSNQQPEVDSDATDNGATDGSHVRYIARFNDPLAATMHVHEVLRRKLVDLDEHMYRTDVISAVAALESIDLRHERVYLDPALAHDSAREIARQTEAFVASQQRRDRLFQAMGFVGIAILLFNLFFFSLA